ncbi:MAG: hypothetical protein EOP68_13790, partial [Sphingomonas sp.]
MTRMLRAATRGGGVALIALIAGSPALAQDARRVIVTPYVEASQILDADLNGGDVVTYTTLAAGLDGSMQTERVAAQASVRYEHRFSYDDRIGDQDVVSGIARADVQLTRSLSIEAGGIATRGCRSVRG